MNKDYKEIKTEVDALMEELKQGARENGVMPYSKQYKEVADKAKRLLLEQAGIDAEDYLREEERERGFDSMKEAVDDFGMKAKNTLSDLLILNKEAEANLRIEEREEQSRNERTESIVREFKEKIKGLKNNQPKVAQ